MYIHYAFHFSDETEAEDNTTHSGRGTCETSNGIQAPIDRNQGVYYKMFLFDMFQFQLFVKYE